MAQRVALPAVLSVLAVVAAACSSITGGSATPQSLATAASNPAPGAGSVPTVLVLDASGSMTTNDAPGARIDAAKTAATTLVDALPDTAQLGLVTYGTGTGSSDAEKAAGCQDVATLTKLGPMDRAKTKQEIDGLRPSGYTPISLALQRSAALLPADGQQAIVLVSDGEDTCGTPPCDVAKQLRTQHSGLAISTVGFKTEGAASEQLRCVATSTGGLFVTAANANQLVARLLAIQDVGKARTSLSSTGFDGVEIGKLAADIRKAHADFPEVATQGQVQVLWHDCDFGFADGVLTSIAPSDGGRTVDGLTAGASAAKATALYGPPVPSTDNKDGTTTAVYTADESAGTAYRMLLNGNADTGTIKTIVLCRCLPKKPAPSTAPHAGPETVVLKPVDAQGNTTAGWTKNSSQRATAVDCSYTTPSPSAVDGGVYSCSPAAASADACWPTAGGSYVLCLQDPFARELTLLSASGIKPKAKAVQDPSPLGLVLDDGTQCRLRNGGSWGSNDTQPDYVGYYSCKVSGSFAAVWGPYGGPGIKKGPNGWTVQTGSGHGPLKTHTVVKAILVGVA